MAESALRPVDSRVSSNQGTIGVFQAHVSSADFRNRDASGFGVVIGSGFGFGKCRI